jgi:short-subunit dehydrogenase
MKSVEVDLADSEAMAERVQEAMACFGRIDAVVHCGGISQRSLAKDTALEVDRRVMEIDYFGTVALTKAVLPQFIKQGSGQFVVVTSLMGLFSSPLRSGYCGAKHALHGFFESLRAEVHEAGIRITMVCPGFIHTDISLNAVVGDGTKQGTMDEKTGKGLSAEACAEQLVNAARKQRPEVLIGRSEVFGAYLKRFFPNVLRRVMRKAAVT